MARHPSPSCPLKRAHGLGPTEARHDADAPVRPRPGLCPQGLCQVGVMCSQDPSQAGIRHVGRPAEPAQGDIGGTWKKPWLYALVAH